MRSLRNIQNGGRVSIERYGCVLEGLLISSHLDLKLVVIRELLSGKS